MTSRTFPLDVFLIETLALGTTAPLLSVTTPDRVAPANCAVAGARNKSSRKRIDTATHATTFKGADGNSTEHLHSSVPVYSLAGKAQYRRNLLAPGKQSIRQIAQANGTPQCSGRDGLSGNVVCRGAPAPFIGSVLFCSAS